MVIFGAIEPTESLQIRLRLDFGLRPAILAFNEWAVPGLGGAFFVRQLTWSCLGIMLAQEMDQPTMAAKIAEALEAFSGWIALKRSKDYAKDDRVQGKRKFKEVGEISFSAVSAGGAYVTVPFRRAATGALPGLGLCVRAEARFNALELSPSGVELAHAALKDRKASDLIRRWIRHPSKALTSIDDRLKKALLPGAVSEEECSIVGVQLLSDARRACLVRLLEVEADELTSLQTSEGQAKFLINVTDDNHRAQLDACFAFERMRIGALKAAQELANCIKATQQSWGSLARSVEVGAVFLELERYCATLTSKLSKLSGVPPEITTFCAEQTGNAAMETRIKALATRLPLVMSVLDHGLDRGLGFTDTLLAAEASDPTEGESIANNSPIPRPLLRLKRLHNEILAGASNAT